MRRIYRPDNIITSEQAFLLGDAVDFTRDQSGGDAPPPDYQAECDYPCAPPDDDHLPDAATRAASYAAQETARLEALRDQIIAQATSEAARLIQEGHIRAQAEYNNALVRAAEQIERDRQAACQEGRQQAYTQTVQDITDCIHGIEQALIRLESAQATFITGYEQDLKWMAIEIAQKVLVDTVAEDDTRLLPLVLAAVNSVDNAPWMTVEISEQVTGLLTQLQQRLAGLSDAGRVGLRLVDAPPDTCIVETPGTVFDASITQQLENLKGYFAAEQG